MSEKQYSNQEDLIKVPAGGLTFERFDEKNLLAFYERSNSAETRRAYKRVTREFFQYFKWRHPRLITSEQITGWRDKLKERRAKARRRRLRMTCVGDVCPRRMCAAYWAVRIAHASKELVTTR